VGLGPVDTLAPVLRGRVGLSPTMVGRVDPLRDLRDLVVGDAVDASDLPTIALVAGEPGIGKTRLVQEALRAASRDTVVVTAAAEPGSLGRPRDVLRQLGDDLAMVLSGTGRVVVVVDDLHWIDAESAAGIDDLARTARPGLLLIATYRPNDLRRGAPGGDLIGRFERRNEVTQIRLARLDRSEVSAMMAAIIGSTPSSSAVEAVVRRSGGVPFVVEELTRCIGPDGCRDDVFDVQLPWSLEDLVRQQLDGMGEAQRSLADALAVLGRPVTIEVLALAAGADVDIAERDLKPLLDDGVVISSPDDRVWFHHALVADAVAQRLLGRERRRLHQRCYEALLAHDPDDHSALAEHARGAGRYELIAEIARRGARAALERGASFQALRLAVDGLDEEPEDVELRAVATEAAWRLDFGSEALAHAERWLAATTDALDRVEATRFVARLHFELGNGGASDAMTTALLEASAAGDRRVVARALAAASQLRMLAGDARAVDLAEAAMAMAREVGDRRTEVQALVEWGSANFTINRDRAAALEALRLGAASAREIGDHVLLGRALNNMYGLVPPHSPEAAAICVELGRTATEHGLDKFAGLTFVWWDVLAAHARGDLAAYRFALEIQGGGLPSKKHRAQLSAELAHLAAEEGRITDALAAIQGFDPEDDGPWCMEVDGLVLESVRLGIAGLAGDRDAATAALERLVSKPMQWDAWWMPTFVVQAAHVALDVGISPTEVKRSIDHYLAAVPGADRCRQFVDPLLAMAMGDHERAPHLLLSTLDAAPDELARPIAASLELAAAQSLLAVGDRDGATVVATRAHDHLARWPGWRRDRVDAFLSRLTGTSAAAVEGLTARESEVAALVAEGLTNGQLAQRLYISPKTASVHVSNILSKLHLANRAEIAAWHTRRELIAS
jgi:DNA-binding NarL/FixJ family response regulator